MKRQAYLDLYGSQAKQRKALALAHDIRKFEIDLYWRRATYFWAFIAVAFAGFFASSTQSDSSSTFVIACLGLLFSLAWYLVNRGSSAWQRNWEVHVDLLEDEISGPLHKAIVSRGTHKFWDLLGPYSYSPSRLNTALSLLLVLVWIILIARTLARILAVNGGLITVITVGVLTLAAGLCMLFWAQSGRSSHVNDVDVTVRTYD